MATFLFILFDLRQYNAKTKENEMFFLITLDLSLTYHYFYP